MTAYLQPGPERGAFPAAAQRARELVLRYGWNAMAYQILNPGIALWFGEEAVVGYVEAGGYWVVAGAPICAPGRLGAVSAAFEREAHAHGARVCYFGAQERLADTLASRGALARLLLGAQPVWRPAELVATFGARASLRAQAARARNKGVAVVPWDAAHAHGNPELLRCLAEWLETRGLPPMHFLVEVETLQRVGDRRVLVAERDGQVVGFLLASPVPARNGWLVEQMIRGRGAPNGTIELLLETAARAFAGEGADYLTLGLAPLSRRAGFAQPAQRLPIRLALMWTRAHARRFYNFDGLDAFKAKFQPESWEPIYAIATGPRVPLRMLYAIAGAFGGEAPVLFIGRALLRALGQELRWAGTRVERRIQHLVAGR